MKEKEEGRGSLNAVLFYYPSCPGKRARKMEARAGAHNQGETNATPNIVVIGGDIKRTRWPLAFLGLRTVRSDAACTVMARNSASRRLLWLRSSDGWLSRHRRQ